MAVSLLTSLNNSRNTCFDVMTDTVYLLFAWPSIVLTTYPVLVSTSDVNQCKILAHLLSGINEDSQSRRLCVEYSTSAEG